LILAVVVFLAFGLGTLSELQRVEDIEPWLYRRWVARMTGVLSLAVIAAATCWGLYRLRTWGRWALTVVTALPVPALLCGWLFLSRNLAPGLRWGPDPAGLTALSVMSALSCPLLLFLMWSPTGRVVFSPGYARGARRNAERRAGCLGVVAAFVVALAGFASYLVLLQTVLSLLAALGADPLDLRACQAARACSALPINRTYSTSRDGGRSRGC
jgi:hypothetical protein